MSGLLGAAVSGLKAFQRSLETTSHNIVNANTEGYSRQRVELATKPAQFIGAGFVGSGVEVADVSRSYDQFITGQLRTATSAFGEADHYQKLASQVDNMLADPSTGMANTLKNFFNSINEVADDPASIPARQVMLSEMEMLTQRFGSMNARFEDMRAQVNSDLRLMVNDVNSLASSIADLNVQIASESGKTSGNQLPNNLLDERDLLLNKLSEMVKVSVVPQSSGMVNVFIGQGQTLVLDGNPSTLNAVPSEFDPSRLEIELSSSTSKQTITPYLNGGKLSGTLRFRDEVLDPAQQKLGQVAVGLAMEANALHESGFDLDGVQGEKLFDFAGEDIFVAASPENQGNLVVTAQFQDLNDPSTPNAAKNVDFSDYRLAYDGTNYTLTRERDNFKITLAPQATSDPNIVNLTYPSPSDPSVSGLPGINITVDTSAGGAVNGDQFLIRPTYDAAKKIQNVVDDPRKIAAATNIETDPLTGEPVPKLDASGNPILDASGNPVYVTINGPMPGDNRNALNLANLENKLGLLGGTASFHDAYGQLVTGTGTLTRAANLSASAQETVLNQAKERRESVAGVNLDEEAANLIKFQQAYQAAAQAISVSNDLFNALIGAIR
ncbi:MAG: flagellar hook-associated protein FlgK [Methylomicrobium sp.]